MKKLLKIVSLTLGFAFAFIGTACNFNAGVGGDSAPKDWREEKVNCEISPTTYTGVEKLKSAAEISEYNKATKNTLPCENGVVVSPYYKLKING